MANRRFLVGSVCATLLSVPLVEAIANNMGCCVLPNGNCTTATQRVCDRLAGVLQGIGTEICNFNRCSRGVGCQRCFGGPNDGKPCEDAKGCPGGQCIAIFYPACPADLDGTDDVGFPDLLAVLSAWGTYEPCPPFIPEDIDKDCEVGFDDLLAVLSAWGPCE